MLKFVLLALGAVQAVAFDAARWDLVDPGARLVPYLGRPSLFLDNGLALARDTAFGDGTIDVDMAFHGHAGFAGVVFRAADEDDYELIYLRPQRSRQPDALQYTPIIGGSEAWQLYSGDGYTAAAELPLNRWVHLRVVVEGYTARVFVDRAVEPQLVVRDLKRPWARGRVGLWGRFGAAHFANFTVTPAESAAPARPADLPASPRLLLDWALGPALMTSAVNPARLPDPATQAGWAWTEVRAEHSGVVNIARYRASARTAASPRGDRDLVFARYVLTASRAGRVKLTFGYSDAVHIFVNGRLIFAGESGYQSRDPAFLGIVTLGPDAIYLDLQTGRNDIVFAVSETFGGWGFAAMTGPPD